MAGPAADLSPQILSDLRVADRGRPLLSAAGLRLELWEACCLAFTDRALLRREVERLETNGREGNADASELAARVRELRARTLPLLERLRAFLGPASGGSEEAERREMVLGFIAGSPAALQSAERWVSEPERLRPEAALKLQVIETLVERYRRALRERPGEGLGAPSGLRAEPRDGRIEISRDPFPGASSYILKRAEGAELPFLPVALTRETRHADASAVDGSTYRYAVVAITALGESSASYPVEAATAPPPPAPAGVDVSPASGEVSITWTPVSGAGGYRVYRAPAPHGPWAAVADVAVPGHTDGGLPDGVPHYYCIRAVTPAGEGPASEPVRALPLGGGPGAPGRLMAVPGDRQVLLRWSPGRDATAHVLLRSDRPGAPPVEVARPESTMHLDAGLENGASYVYVVRALGAGGRSADSPPVEARPLGPPPAPANLAAALGADRLTLSWDASKGADGYTVRRAIAADGPFAPLAEVVEVRCDDTIVEEGRTYFYAVAARNAAGEGPGSPPLRVRFVSRPPAPRNLSARPEGLRVRLAWDAVAGATGYRIRRATGASEELRHSDVAEWTDEAAEGGRTVVYAVRAVNEAGEGPEAAPVVVTPVAPPPPPSGLSARPGDARVSLRWDPVPGAERYSVRRSEGPEGPFTELPATEGTEAVDTGVANGTEYVYRVVAVNEGGESAPADPVTARPAEPPPAPSGLRAAGSDATVLLEWTPAAGAARYRVERAAAADGSFEELAVTAAASHRDGPLENGKTYSYRVSALNDSGASPPSETVTATPVAPPQVPQGIRGRHGDRQVTILWEPVEGATHYRVKRATDRNGPWATAGSTARETFTDTDLENGTTYFYMVRALNAGGKGPYSKRLRATPLSPPPAPSDLSASPGDGEVALSWPEVPKALRYIVKRGTSPAGPYSHAGRTTEPSFVDSGLRNGSTVYYLVSAVNPSGEGPPAAVEATPLPIPEAPEQVVAAPGDGRVALSWAPTAWASSYKVKGSLSPEGPYATLGTPSSPSWIEEGLENGTTRFYVVSALNARGEGPESIVVQAVPSAPPPAPAGFRARAGAGRVDLAWDGWPTADRFRVKRSETAGGPYAVVGNPVAPAYADFGVRNGRTYFYRITALNAAGESAPSDEAAACPSSPAGRGDEVPTLEQFQAGIVGGDPLPTGVDPDRVLDLRRVEQLRTLLEGTGQRFEAWELAALIAKEGPGVRRTLDELLRLKNEGDSDAFEAGALALFDRILAVRSGLGGLVRRLRAYVELLGLPAPDPEAMEIALSFVVAAERSRARAELWLEDPLRHREPAAAYFRKALEIAGGYLDAMKR